MVSLAEDTNMTVTHNYAPTASFKTMVDGPGNVTKGLYRRLERNEEEGTRCSTSYETAVGHLANLSCNAVTPLRERNGHSWRRLSSVESTRSEINAY